MQKSTLENYVAFLSKVREESGIGDLKPDDGGLVSVRVDDTYTLNIQYVEATSKILLFVEVAAIPLSASASVYRMLLEGSLFGKETAGGFFGLEPVGGNLVYHYLYEFDPVTSIPTEFVELTESILQLVDFWAGRIRAELDGASTSDGEPIKAGLFQDARVFG